MKLTAINNPVALRRDDTVGTRIFVGDTMIYGDTGWRHIDGLMTDSFGFWAQTLPMPTTPGQATFLTMKREENTITIDGHISASPELEGTPRDSTQFLSTNIPVGFQPHLNYILTGSYWLFTTGEKGVIRSHTSNIELRAGDGNWKSNELIVLHASWETKQPWPTTLPGLPA